MAYWVVRKLIKSFNSTRCIRNRRTQEFCGEVVELSTPHGALGTPDGSAAKETKTIAFNSTRCIRNGFEFFQVGWPFLLSTPHGALGTFDSKVFIRLKDPFNSTRCIRNFSLATTLNSVAKSFQLHTVH